MFQKRSQEKRSREDLSVVTLAAETEAVAVTEVTAEAEAEAVVTEVAATEVEAAVTEAVETVAVTAVENVGRNTAAPLGAAFFMHLILCHKQEIHHHISGNKQGNAHIHQSLTRELQP